MYSAYKLSKQGDNIQAWCTPVPIWKAGKNRASYRNQAPEAVKHIKWVQGKLLSDLGKHAGE